jgi:hypothetical protein
VFHRNSSSAEVKNEWSCTCLPPAPLHPYGFMALTGTTLHLPLPSTVIGTSLGLTQTPVYGLSGTTAADDEVLRTKISADTIKA